MNINVFFYSDLMYDDFTHRAQIILGRNIDSRAHDFIKSISITTNVAIHTTILGNLLFLDLYEDIAKRNNSATIVEVGSFDGGNALIASLFTDSNNPPPFYIIDSFEGFPDPSRFDPLDMKRGDYATNSSFEKIAANLSFFPNVRVVKGFVPKILEKLDGQDSYGLVFYDCDLYKPALATFEYFWDKIIPGGYLLIHDYIAEDGGYTGVKKAADEYFGKKNITVHSFWENTMGLIIKSTK